MQIKTLLLTTLFSMNLSVVVNSEESQTKFTGDVAQDVKMMLKEGVNVAEIFGPPTVNSRLLELTTRFKAAIAKNPIKFQEAMTAKAKDSSFQVESTIFGLSKAEREEMLQLLKDTKPSSFIEDTLTIKVSSARISFHGATKIPLINSVEFDLKNNTVFLDGYDLKFKKEINVTNSDNGLKSAWRGYKWRFEYPEDFDLSLADLSSLTLTGYTLVLAVLEESGKTYVSLEGRSYEEGVELVKYKIQFTLK